MTNTTVQNLTISPIKHGGNTEPSWFSESFDSPFYNMGETVSPQGTQDGFMAETVDGNQPEIFGTTSEFKDWIYKPKLDNLRIVKTDKGDLPVIHSIPTAGEIAQLDWVNFGIGLETWHQKYLMLNDDEHEAYDHIVEELERDLIEIFGFGIAKKRDKGMHFNKYSWELEDNLGLVLAGHSSKRISVQINGTGCALAAQGWQERLYKYLTQHAIRPKITRADLAHDDFEGKHLNVDWANMQDGLGGFYAGTGCMPIIQHLGSWKRITGKGRTLTIGTRESGKYARIYEKGKKEGAKHDPWTRAEVEFKSSDRIIPFEILISPSQYFIAAYPCFAEFDQYCQPEKIATTKKAAKISWEKSKEIVKTQFGKYIAAYKKVYSDSEIINFIIANDQTKTPKRLTICDQLALSVERNKQHAKAFSYSKFQQSTQRSQFDAAYS